MATAFIPSLPRARGAAEQCYELPAPGLRLSADHLQRDSGSALLCYCERETGQKRTALWTSGAAGRQGALSVSLWEPQGSAEQASGLCPFPTTTIPCGSPV